MREMSGLVLGLVSGCGESAEEGSGDIDAGGDLGGSGAETGGVCWDPSGVGTLDGSPCRKDIWPVAQSINGLCWRNHLYPISKGQSESSGATKQGRRKDSPVGKVTGTSTNREMMLRVDPSNRRSVKGGIGMHLIPWRVTKLSSMRQSVEPQSIKVGTGAETCGERNLTIKESGFERAAAFRRISLVARLESVRPPGRAGARESPSSFLILPAEWVWEAQRERRLERSQQSLRELSLLRTFCSRQLCGRRYRSRDKAFLSFVFHAHLP